MEQNDLREQFNDQGYVRLLDFLDASVVAQARCAMEEFSGASSPAAGGSRHNREICWRMSHSIPASSGSTNIT